MADTVTITIAPPGPARAIAVDPPNWVFRSSKQVPEPLRVLATFDRGGGSTTQLEVSASSFGTTYAAFKGDSVVHVDANGLVSPVAAGEDTIQVSYGGFVASVPVVVQGASPFTDNVLTPDSSPIRAVHITELRERIDLLRDEVGLAPYLYADSTLTAGATILRAQHILDLRAALTEVYNKATLTPPTFTDSDLPSGSSVKLVHIAELRAAVIAIE